MNCMRMLAVAVAALALGADRAAAFTGQSPERAKMESGLRFGEGRTPAVNLAVDPENRGNEVRAFLREAARGGQAPMGFKAVAVPSPKSQRHEDWRNERDWTIAGLAVGAVATALMYFLAGPMTMSLYGKLGLGGFIGGVVGALIPKEYQSLAVGLALAGGVAAAALSLGAVPVLVVAAAGAAGLAAFLLNKVQRRERSALGAVHDMIGSGLAGMLIGVAAPWWGGAVIGKLLGRRKS